MKALVDWIIDTGFNGLPPLCSAEELAAEYRADPNLPDSAARVSSLINWETSKNFSSGLVTGLGGAITLPVSIPSAFGASWLLQARLAGTIALLHGHRLTSDRVRTLVLVSLLGDAGKELLRHFGISVAQKLGEQALRRLPGRILIELNKQVGFRLLTKAGERGVVNLIKFVPLLGGAVSGITDAAACRAVGHTAAALLPPVGD